MRRHLSGIPKNDLANEIIHPGIQGLRLDGFEPVAPIQMSIIARAMVVFPPWKFTRPTFDVATVKTFNRTEPFIFPSIYATRTNDRSLKTSAKKTWRHPPPSPLGLSSKGGRDTYRGFGVETKRPRCFENALLNRSTSPCFPPSQDKSSKKRAIFAGEKWPIDELLVLFKPVNFIFGERGKGGSIESDNFGLLFVSARKCGQSTHRQRERERIDRTEVRIADWFRVFRRKWETPDDEVFGAWSVNSIVIEITEERGIRSTLSGQSVLYI